MNLSQITIGKIVMTSNSDWESFDKNMTPIKRRRVGFIKGLTLNACNEPICLVEFADYDYNFKIMDGIVKVCSMHPSNLEDYNEKLYFNWVYP